MTVPQMEVGLNGRNLLYVHGVVEVGFLTEKEDAKTQSMCNSLFSAITGLQLFYFYFLI